MTRVGTHNLATREAWLEKALLAVPAGSRILDAGAGELQYRRLCAHLEYVSQDFGQYDGLGDGRGLQTKSWDQARLDIVSDITEIPEPDASFDAVMCVEVLEHLPEPVKAIAEFSRLVRPGGQLIVTAPFCSLTHFAPYHFHTGFNRYFYERHLPEHGFDIADLQTNGNFFEFVAQETRRVPRMAGTYAGEGVGLIDRLGIRLMLRTLDRLSKGDRGSSEMLNFGCHVRAVRR